MSGHMKDDGGAQEMNTEGLNSSIREQRSDKGMICGGVFFDCPEILQYVPQHKPKMTMVRGGVLRSTRAGEKSRKASTIEPALPHPLHEQEIVKIVSLQEQEIVPLQEQENQFLCHGFQSLVDRIGDVLVGMRQSEFLSCAEGLEETHTENHSFVEFPLSSLPHIEPREKWQANREYLIGTYFRKPSMSMRLCTAILVAMTREQLKDWVSDTDCQKRGRTQVFWPTSRTRKWSWFD